MLNKSALSLTFDDLLAVATKNEDGKSVASLKLYYGSIDTAAAEKRRYTLYMEDYLYLYPMSKIEGQIFEMTNRNLTEAITCEFTIEFHHNIQNYTSIDNLSVRVSMKDKFDYDLNCDDANLFPSFRNDTVLGCWFDYGLNNIVILFNLFAENTTENMISKLLSLNLNGGVADQPRYLRPIYLYNKIFIPMVEQDQEAAKVVIQKLMKYTATISRELREDTFDSVLTIIHECNKPELFSILTREFRTEMVQYFTKMQKHDIVVELLNYTNGKYADDDSSRWEL